MSRVNRITPWLLAAALCATIQPWAVAADKPERLVTIGSAITETVFALHAQKAIVAVDTTSMYPQAATRLPNVGYARTLSAEGILALAPTQVIANEEAGPASVLRQIQNAGVPVTVLNARQSFEGTVSRVSQLGELLGKQAEAKALTTTMQADWARVRAAIDQRKTPAPRVLFIMSPTPSQIMVAGSDTAAQAMLTYAGAVNAISGFSGYKPLTPEAVIAARPDIILFTEQGLSAIGGIDNALRLPGVAKAVDSQRQRILSMDAVWLLGFGTRLPAAVAQLDSLFTRAMQP